MNPALLLASALAAPLTTHGRRPLEAQPPVGLDPTGCGGCHRRVHRDWQSSAHATSWTDPHFQASWAEQRLAWCVHCHAPLAEPGGPPGAQLGENVDLGDAADQGVSCAACHLRDGEVLTADPPGWLARRAHAARQEDGLADGTLCAGCHDFEFQRHTPAAPMSWSDTPAQDTADEWRSSWAAARDVGCSDCHQRRGRHRFPGGHDAALLRDTIDVAMAWRGDTLAATLTARGAAHAVPTGDPFRQLVVELCPDPGCQTQTGRAVWGRRFRPTETSWELTLDTRIPPAVDGPSASRTLELTPTGPARTWRLWLDLADPALGLPDTEARILIATGMVPDGAPP